MATVQRKLVHKQFNSPIGLYSDQNVKETLDRELRAFNGNVGIDQNDIPRAPFNLLSSSVAKMVAEEDYEKTHPASRAVSERQSRPRQRRPITREDVLKINRRHPRRRDISWPPSENHFRSRSSSEEIHFDESVRKRHEIFHLKEMFDRGTIPTSTIPFAINERNYSQPSLTDEIGSDLDMRSLDGNLGHEMNAQFSTAYRSAKCQSAPRSCRQPEWPPRSYYEDDDVNNNVKLSQKTFYLPESELHIGNIEPIRAYWHNISARSSSTPSRNYSSSIRRNGGDELKRWRSHDNITTAHYRNSLSPCNRQLSGREVGDSHKKDNLPLERNKSNSYNELPPLKPRREDRKDVHHTKKKLNLNNSQHAGRRMWEPVSWISAGGLKLDVEHQHPDAHLETGESKSAKLANCNANDGQYNLVKPTARNDTNESSRNTMKSGNTNVDGNHKLTHSNEEEIMNDCLGRKCALTVDCEDKMPLNNQKFRQQPYNSKDINVNQENAKSESKEKFNSKILYADKECSWSPDEYTPYDRGAGLMSSHNQVTCEGSEQTESLLLRRNLVEEAIALDVQRISEYMKRAEQEALSADRYANESIATTPLKEILKQIVLPKAFLVSGNSSSLTAVPLLPKTTVFDPATIVVGMRAENMPVVDQVLVELVALSRALKAFDNTSTSADNNFHLKEPCIVELQSEGKEMLGDTVAASADINSQAGYSENPTTEIEPGFDLEAEIESEAVDSTVASSDSRTENGTPVDKVIHSKNILSGYLITKQSQDEIFKKIHSREMDLGSIESVLGTKVCCSEQSMPTSLMASFESSANAAVPCLASLAISAIIKDNPSYNSYSCFEDNVRKHNVDIFDSDNVLTSNTTDYNRKQTLHIDNIGKGMLKKTEDSFEDNWPPSLMLNKKQVSSDILTDSRKMISEISEENHKMIQERLRVNQQELCSSEAMNSEQAWPGRSSDLHEPLRIPEIPVFVCNLNQVSSMDPATKSSHALALHGKRVPSVLQKSPAPIIPWRHSHHQHSSQQSCEVPVDTFENFRMVTSSKSPDTCDYVRQDEEDSLNRTQQNYRGQYIDSLSSSRHGRCRTRLDSNSSNRFRSTSQPSSSATYPLPASLIRQNSLDSSESQSYGSPRLYMSGHFTHAKGYKRVAWPPVDTAPVYATVPQPQNPPPSSYEVNSQPQQKPEPTNYNQPQQYQQQYQSNPQYQQPQYQQQQFQQPQSNYQAQPTYQSQPNHQPQYNYHSELQRDYQQPKPQYQQTQYQAPRCDPSPVRQSQPRYGNTPSAAPGSTVSFAGGIARSCSPARPVARQYIPGQINMPARSSQSQEQSRQPNQYLSSNQYQSAGQYQQIAADNPKVLSPQSSLPYASPSQSGPMTSSPLAWSHVRPPTPTRAGYIMQNNQSQYQRTNSVPLGSDSSYGAYQSSQNEYRPQATQAFQPVSHEPSRQNYQAQNFNNYQPQPQQQQQQQQQYYTQPQQQRQASPYGRGQSPGIIQLRKEAPISQQPAPVYASQPATATFRGGSSMRGDLKWPPPEYKAQAVVENEERRRIALGPVCRPRRVQKDYSQFFAKNALNHYYPGYKIPPGTQHMYTQY